MVSGFRRLYSLRPSLFWELARCGAKSCFLGLLGAWRWDRYVPPNVGNRLPEPSQKAPRTRLWQWGSRFRINSAFPGKWVARLKKSMYSAEWLWLVSHWSVVMATGRCQLTSCDCGIYGFVYRRVTVKCAPSNGWNTEPSIHIVGGFIWRVGRAFPLKNLITGTSLPPSTKTICQDL